MSNIRKSMVFSYFQAVQKGRTISSHIRASLNKLEELLRDIASDKIQPLFTCLKLAIKTLELGVKYVQS